MKNFLRYYNQNKETIWLLALIAFMIVVAVHTLNNYIKNNSINNNQTNTIQEISISEKNEEKARKSEISSTQVSKEEYVKEKSIIDTFIDNCNNGKAEEAYNILTDECKEMLFPNIEVFENNYLQRIFSNKKTYSVQNYYGSIYKIKYTEDMLATGKKGDIIQDYFTIYGNKLSINEYIGRHKIERSGVANNITVNVLYKDVFMDYEQYTVEVKNGTTNTIKLDSGESTKTIYLLNSKNVSYSSYRHELLDHLLELTPGVTRTFNIKFYNNYVSTNVISKMVFSDIILDINNIANRGNVVVNI